MNVNIENYFSSTKPLYIFLPNNGCGGAEKLSIELAEVEAKKRDVTLIFGNMRGSLKVPKSVKIINLNKSKVSKCMWELIKIIPSNNVDVFTTMYHSNIICLLVKILKPKIYLIIRESTSFEYYKNNFSIFKYLAIKFFMNTLYRLSDKLILPSTELKKKFVANINYFPESKIEIKYNPLNTKKVLLLGEEPINKDLWEKTKKHVFINIGRLDKNKNQQNIIHKLNELDDKDTELILLGDGPERESLRHLIKSLELEDRVHLLGFQENPYKFLKASDTFVLSSLAEGFPNVLVQARAFNLNIISTDCPTGPSEVLKDYEKGFLDNLELSNFDTIFLNLKKHIRTE